MVQVVGSGQYLHTHERISPITAGSTHRSFQAISGFHLPRNIGKFVHTDEKNEKVPGSRKTNIIATGFSRWGPIWDSTGSLSIKTQQDTP